MNPGRMTRQSPNTCSACRARKVRCDGRRNVCTNCERLGHRCSFQQPLAVHQPVPRRRAHNACLPCHSRKIRCNEGIPSCQRCLRLSIRCVYPHNAVAPVQSSQDRASTFQEGAQSIPETEPSRGSSAVVSDLGQADSTALQSPKSPSSGPSSELLPPKQLVLQSLAHFFRHIRHIPVFSFLHQASIMEQYHSGVLDQAVVLSLVGIVSASTDLGDGIRELGSQYISLAEKMILEDMENPTIAKVQALIFIIKHRALCRRFSSVFMLMAIATRFAMGLRLNYEDPKLSFLARESCRRTMWSLYLIDTNLAGGYQDFALSPAEMIHIQLPCSDENFEMDIPGAAGSLHQQNENSKPSPLSLTIRVMHIRHQILQFTKKAVATDGISDLPAQIHLLQRELDTYISNLPPSYKLSKHNIQLHAYSNTLSNFIAMHITWHGCHCILYRLAIADLIESLPPPSLEVLDVNFTRTCQLRCFQISKSLSEILRTIMSLRLTSVPLDLDLAACIYQCVRMLRHSYDIIGDAITETAADVISYCNTCLDFLRTMFPDCEAIDAIRRDAESLVQRGIPELELHSQHEKSNAGQSHHILSKHSLVGQIQMPDKGQSFILSPSSSDAKDDALRKMDLSPIASNQTPDQPSAFSPSFQSSDIAWTSEWFLEGDGGVDEQIHALSELGLPEFAPDSSIFQRGSWLDMLPTE